MLENLSFQFEFSLKTFYTSVIAVLTVLTLNKAILPAYRSFKNQIKLSKISNTKTGHWLYGHLKEYNIQENATLGIIRDVKKFPALFNFWIGPLLSMQQVYHPDINKILLKLPGPKSNIIYDYFRDWIGDGLVLLDGEKWKKHRKLVTPAFHFNVLKQYTKTFVDCADVMLDKFEDMTSEPIDVSEHLSLMTLDSILICAYSRKTDCQFKSIKDNEYLQAVDSVLDCIKQRMDSPIYKFDVLYNLSSVGKRYHEGIKDLHTYTAKIIEERKKKRSNEHFNENEFVDFLDMLLKTQEESNGLTDEEIRDEVETFLFAGHDTTATSLAWLFYNLARHPEIQNKCREEINEVLMESDGKIRTDHLNKLKYLTMCIKESLRLHSTVYNIGRKLDRDLEFTCPFNKTKNTFPSGSEICASIYVQHRNPAIWQDPEVYNPERFSAENISKIPPHAFIPFSSGPRNCVGQNFAMNEIKVVMGQTLKRFKLSIDKKSPEPKFSPKTVLKSSTGIFIKLEKL